MEESVPSSEVRCGVCDRRTLPYSRFCLHRESVIGLHASSDVQVYEIYDATAELVSLSDIAQDEDQILYSSCTASEANSIPCGNTVFDFLLNQPQCSKHVTKAVSCSYSVV